MDRSEPALLQHLRSEAPAYYGTAMRVREAAATWLANVPSTFPHYTQHTIDHSDEIVRQIDKILYWQGEPERNVHITPVELYVFCVSAYLHDAGMVLSPEEEAKVVDSPQWESWLASDEQLASAWTAAKSRITLAASEESVLVAHRELRLLIAEYIRQSHHQRSVAFMLAHASQLADLDFNDHRLRSAIGSVCRGHNLSQDQLDDIYSYPTSTDLLGQDANVRLVASLLRLGDLLDVREARACDLVRSAVEPLPMPSSAHWTQYRRIDQISVNSKAISLVARCERMDEHRLLRDWCQWICDEIGSLGRARLGSRRWETWDPPRASMRGPEPTIDIQAGPGASYQAVDWRFQFDELPMIRTLINDVHSEPRDYIRELIQNSADASRCAVIDDLVRSSDVVPSSLTSVGQQILDRHSIHVTLSEEPFGQTTAQYLTVADHGTGMDPSVITRHFLQIGNSYYTSPEFRRRYQFAPTSRFGIGFMSVFSVSNDVLIETRTRDADRGVQMRLTGPSDYFLVDTPSRHLDVGTRIQVRLNSSMTQGELTDLLEYWLVSLEFPVIVDDLGRVKTIRMAKFVEEEVRDPIGIVDRFRIRLFPSEIPGVEGEFQVLEVVEKSGECRWDRADWYKYHYLDEHPGAVVLDIPPSSMALNGIRIHPGRFAGHARERYSIDGAPATRLDVRRQGVRVSASRDVVVTLPFGSDISSQWGRLLDQHLVDRRGAGYPSDWRYLQGLIAAFSIGDRWLEKQGTVPWFVDGVEQSTSWRVAAEVSAITTVAWMESDAPLRLRQDRDRRLSEACARFSRGEAARVMSGSQYKRMARKCREAIFDRLRAEYASVIDDGVVVTRWTRGDPRRPFDLGSERSYEVGVVSDSEIIGVVVGIRGTFSDYVLLNETNPLIEWALRTLTEGGGTDSRSVNKLAERIVKAVRYASISSDFWPFLREFRGIDNGIGGSIPRDEDVGHFIVPDYMQALMGALGENEEGREP